MVQSIICPSGKKKIDGQPLVEVEANVHVIGNCAHFVSTGSLSFLFLFLSFSLFVTKYGV
jgi:hypothetical protein